MVMIFTTQSAFSPVRYQVYARLFGRCIEKIRESKCQSLEEAATLDSGIMKWPISAV